MSWRQPDSSHVAAIARNSKRTCVGALIRHLRNLNRVLALKKFSRIAGAEPGILRFNTKEKLVATGCRKPGNIKHRMIRLRQAIQCKHAKYGCQRGAEHRALKCH